MSLIKRKLVLTLCVEEEDQHQHSFAEVEIPLRAGAEEKDVADAVQRASYSAYLVLKKDIKDDYSQKLTQIVLDTLTKIR